MDRDDSDRPQRRSALVASELARLDIDIAALSEVRFAEQGSLSEQGACYTLYWSGKATDERRLSGVGFMMKTSIANRLHSLPVGHSDRIMSLRLPIQDNKFATLISVYAPTLQADLTVKEAFYQELHDLLQRVDSNDKVLILGDFNARVGQDSDVWKDVLGRHGIGNCNDNGRLLLEFCSEHNLVITNSLFHQRDRFKTTWMHPRSKHWHLLDYVLTRQRDSRDIHQTRVMPSADCYTDHRLIRCKVAFVFKPPPRKKGPQGRRFFVAKLKDPATKATFQEKLGERLNNEDDLLADPEQLWTQLKTVLHETTEEVVGYAARKHQDWFDQSNVEIQELLGKKRSCHRHLLANPNDQSSKTAYRRACKELQARLRAMKDDWWTAFADRTQRYADMGDFRSFYESLKTVFGPTHQIQAPLRTSDGSSLLTDKDAIMNRWSEHFESLFSDKRTVQEPSLMNIPQAEVKPELDEEPTPEEIEKAISQLNPGKSPGIDGIPAEVYQEGGDIVIDKLHSLFWSCWESGTVPQDLRDAVIVSLYKNKGEKSDCSNYRGITLLSIAGKILARLLLNRLIPTIAEENTPESQCGFRANRGTTDMVFVLRQIQEKCREQNMGLYAAFIDLTKAFDTVSRDGLWKILQRLGCPPKFLTIIRQLHEGQMGQVKHNGSLSASFPITNGVKQGCVLAPTLFSIFFSMMLREAKEGLEDGVYIRFRTDGSVFNLRRLLSLTKTHERLVVDLLFADDCALIAHTQEALQLIVNRFSEAAKSFGLTISLKKTEVMFQPPPGNAYCSPQIKIDNTSLNAVEKFTYLGSVISNDGTVNLDLDNRLARASSTFGRLNKKVWKNHSLRRLTKTKVYRAVVIPTLLYGCESWTLYRKQIKRLEQFHQRCLRSILNIKWQDYVTNEEVLERSELPRMESILLRQQLRWAGHVARMEDTRIPKAVFFGELKQGKRGRGAPRKRFKDQLKKQLSLADIDHQTWQEKALNRENWRHAIREASTEFDLQTGLEAREKRRRRKEGPEPISTTAPEFVCTGCGRKCAARIGLFSHQRACRSD